MSSSPRFNTLVLALTDLDPDSMRPFLTRLLLTGHTKNVADPYTTEIQRLDKALSQLQALASITLARPYEPLANSAPLLLAEGVLDSIVNLPNIIQLSLNIDNYYLDRVPNLHKLTHLRISGFSHSTPEGTELAFTRMSSLQELHIHPSGNIMREPFFHCGGDPMQSITPRVIARMQPLRVLMIMDPPEATKDKSPFLTTEMFDAIAVKHGPHLKRLTVGSLHVISGAAVDAMKSLLRATAQLIRLTLAFPEAARRDIIEAAVTMNHLTEMGILVVDQAEADVAFEQLEMAGQRGPLKALREVTFLIPGDAHCVIARSAEVTQSRRYTLRSTQSSSSAHAQSPQPVDQHREPQLKVMWRRWQPFESDIHDK
ncbi:uncharacterized protein AB675_8172 [Cyphellophora attinorum]|uniref:F-box domain-containing protein n=1 Tax=Cyphellophora attinorum TaxID=1664694 RepID=A0A0N1HVE0_9EURO|nr:uncharacterized protein AB675_8172 [Phialophora attinorum]KPI41232.1 hypothetical protein AB675_8172 [Phialophora attinorum]